MTTEAEYLASAADRPATTWDDVRAAINRLAEESGEWAGAPLPVDGFSLVMEPRYPFPKLHGARLGDRPPEIPASVRIVNQWYSHDRGQRVFVCEDDQGRFAVRLPSHGQERLAYWIDSLAVAYQAFDPLTEVAALGKLRTLIKPHLFTGYLTAGCFLETSKRSGVTYLFRKMRPTVAMKATEAGMKILACLCLHPLGYYEGTFCGVMVPTDEVIAHLMLMRGDEHMFWGKANHHPLWAAQAGL